MMLYKFFWLHLLIFDFLNFLKKKKNSYSRFGWWEWRQFLWSFFEGTVLFVSWFCFVLNIDYKSLSWVNHLFVLYRFILGLFLSASVSGKDCSELLQVVWARVLKERIREQLAHPFPIFSTREARICRHQKEGIILIYLSALLADEPYYAPNNFTMNFLIKFQGLALR